MASSKLELLKKTLTHNGYSYTKARAETFRLLQEAEPQSMREILVKAAGKVDRVSVYRNIDIFEKIGIVHRIYIGWKYKLELSDQFMGHHHHLSCLQCGKVIDIEDETHIDDFIKSIAKQFDFIPQSHQFEVAGYCANCARKKTQITETKVNS
jgi:Fe2+ or Zn2+ uptake regulation protein